MKRKLIKFLTIVALLSPLFYSAKKVNAATETVNDLMVTYGENLLSLDNKAVSFDSGVLTTTKKIYYPGSYESNGLTVIIPKESLNTNYTVTIKYYDIDFTLVGTTALLYDDSMTLPLFEEEYDSVYFNDPTIPNGTFSLSLTVTGLNKNVSLSKLGVMLLDSDLDIYDEYSYKYIEYTSTKGFIDLFNGAKASLEVSYKNPMSKESIENMISIIDACEGDVKLDYDIDTSSYINSNTKVGTYPVNITLKDDKTKTVVGSFNIIVKDTIKPVIEGSDSIEVGAKTEITKAYLESKGYLFSDEYDSQNSLSSTLIITNSLNSTNNLGSGTLTLKLVDTNNNYVEKTVSMTIVDCVKPTIEEIDKNLSISYEYILGVNSLIYTAFNIYDDYDQDLTINIIEDTYTENSRKVGTYNVKIKVTDDYNNSSEASFTVSVYDNIPPVIFLNTYRIETDVTVKLTKDGIVETLMSTGVLDKNETYTISVVVDEYTGNENKIGLYSYQVRCDNKKGETVLKTIEINVSDISEYGGEVITSTAIIENESLNDPFLIIFSVSLVVVSSVTLIILRKKKRNIRPRKY